MTQKALAEKSGLSVECVHKLYNHPRMHVRPATAARLEAALPGFHAGEAYRLSMAEQLELEQRKIMAGVV